MDDLPTDVDELQARLLDSRACFQRDREERARLVRRLHDLARLGRAMRTLQHSYFRTKSPAALAEAKDAERRFDAAVAAVLDPPPSASPALFENEGPHP